MDHPGNLERRGNPEAEIYLASTSTSDFSRTNFKTRPSFPVNKRPASCIACRNDRTAYFCRMTSSPDLGRKLDTDEHRCRVCFDELGDRRHFRCENKTLDDVDRESRAADDFAAAERLRHFLDSKDDESRRFADLPDDGSSHFRSIQDDVESNYFTYLNLASQNRISRRNSSSLSHLRAVSPHFCSTKSSTKTQRPSPSADNSQDFKWSSRKPEVVSGIPEAWRCRDFPDSSTRKLPGAYESCTSGEQTLPQKTGNSCQKLSRLIGGDISEIRKRKTLIYLGFLIVLFVVAVGTTAGCVLLLQMQNRDKESQPSIRTAGHFEDDYENYFVTVPFDFNRNRDSGGSKDFKPGPSLTWAFYEKGSSNGSKYTILDRSMPFQQSQEGCGELGGYLVHVNSLREQLFLEDFIVLHMQKYEESATGEDEVGFWIGAKRPPGSHEGNCLLDQWKWVDSRGNIFGTISGLATFVPGKPDNYYQPEECLFMTHKEGLDESRFLKWDDAPCDDSNLIGGIKGICEVEMK